MLWLCLPWLASIVVAAMVLGEWVEVDRQVGWGAFWIALYLGGALMLAAIVLGLKRHQGNLLIALVLPLISTAAGHWSTPPAPMQEVQRVASPSGALEAVVMKVEDGGPGHIPTLVFVAPKGGKIHPRQPVFRATRVEGLAVQWTDDNDLVLHQAAGKVFDQKTAARVGKTRVNIRYD